MTPSGVDYNWHLVPFKQGYVRVGDEDEIPAATKTQYQPDRSFPVYWSPPSYDAELTYSQIKPILLRKTKLSPADEVVYDFALYMRSVCSGYPAVRETMKDCAGLGLLAS